MKILWLTNVVPNSINTKISSSNTNYGGWIHSAYDNFKSNSNIELLVCSPYINNVEYKDKKNNFIGFSYKEQNRNDRELLVNKFKKIIYDFKPNVIHIWGTEYVHSYLMVLACDNMSNVIVSIQGSTYAISKHYYSALDCKVINNITLKEFIKKDNIKCQRKKFEKKAILEVEILKKVKFTVGRTKFDKSIIYTHNEKAAYFHCNETLRSAFYDKKWDSNDIEKYSIFVTQGYYPIKGLHMLFQAFYLIMDKYPNSKIKISGYDFTKKRYLRLNSYEKHLIKIIKQYKIKDRITFLGELNQEKMLDEYLKSNVYINCSSIENSSNSIAEAMLVGVPIVASYVGGNMDFVKHEYNGYLYQYDAFYMLAYYISNIFSDVNVQAKFSNNSIKLSREIFDREKNTDSLLNIYKKVDESNV